MPPGYRAPDEMVSVQLPKPTIDEILNLYELLTKKRLIRDANLAGPNIPLVVSGQLPKSEAIALIESALLLNGYTLVPVDATTSKVLGASKPAKSEGLPLYNDARMLPAEDRVVSYYMSLDFISSDEAKKIFDQYVQVRAYGSVVPVPNVNAVVITENTPFIRRLVELQRMIDVAGAKIVTEFIPLKRADAEKVAEIVNKLIEKEKSESGQSASPAAPAPAPAASQQAPPAGQPEGSAAPPPVAAAGGPALTPVVAASGKIEVVADARTNRVLVMAPESRMPFFRKLIEELDTAVALEEPFERKLQYVSAGDVLPTLQNVLREGGEKDKGGGEQPGAPNEQEGGNAGDQSGGYTGGGSSTGGAGGGVTGKPDKLRDPKDNTRPISVVVGKSRIIADRAANKIILIGPPDARRKVEGVLQLLDQQPKQVYLATVIGELTLGDGFEVGADYLLKFRNFGNNSGLAASAIYNPNAGTRGNDIVPDPSQVINLIRANTVPLASGLTVYGTIAETVDVYARALATTNRFKVISRPVVYTANNKRAVISSGQQVPVPDTSVSNVVADNSTAVSSSIQYKDVVLKLEVIPLINSNDQVTLQISQQNDSVISQTTVANNQVPVIATQELQTNVTVRNRNTVVLGGLIREEKTRNRRGIPLLSSIPGLGYLFSNTTKNTERRELIVMIQPFIIADRADVVEANTIEKSMSSMTGELYETPFPVRRAELPTFQDYEKLNERKTFRETPGY